MIQAAEQLAQTIGVTQACRVLGIPRSSFYYARQPHKAPAPRPTPERALSQEKRDQVRQVLNSERFQDDPPRQIYATLLDEGTYLCHWRTMYRILEAYGEARERRDHLQHPSYTKPELLATGPNELWSWDITKLKGPAKWTHYYLYVILDVYSRYVPGWLIAERESAALAEALIVETCAKQGLAPDAEPEVLLDWLASHARERVSQKAAEELKKRAAQGPKPVGQGELFPQEEVICV